MPVILVEKVVVKCDGGNCNSVDEFETGGMIYAEIVDLLRTKGWKTSGGCIYCPTCDKRIFGK